jgi:hypothetical protein
MINKTFSLIITIFFPLFSNYSYAGQGIIQETRGNNSPAINVPGGTVNISTIPKEDIALIIKYMQDIKNQYNDCVKFAEEYQTNKLRDLEKNLAEINIKRIGSSNDDAVKWAQEIIEKSPEISKALKEKNDLIDKMNVELSKDIVERIYKLFVYIFNQIDSRTSALLDINHDIQYEKSNYSVFIDSDSNVIPTKDARSIIFPNKKKILVRVRPGRLKGPLVIDCPIIYFSSEYVSFSLIPSNLATGYMMGGDPVLKQHEQIKIENIKYNLQNEDILNDGFKNSFESGFDTLVKYTYGE